MTAKKKYIPNPKNAYCPRIASVTLGGFQVFEEPTKIPLGRITFLFGPNSAGKSAVEDALLLLIEALKRPAGTSSIGSYDATQRSRFERLEEHWRRTSEFVSEDYSNLAPVLTLGVSASMNGGAYTRIATGKNPIKTRVDTREAEIVQTYHLLPDYDGAHSAARNIDLRISNLSLLRLTEGAQIGLNAKHPALSGRAWEHDYEKLANTLPTIVLVEDGWIWLKANNVHLDAARKIDRRDLFMQAHEATLKLKKQLRVDANSVTSFLEEFCDLFDLIHETVLDNISITLDLIPASRTIPTRQQLTYWVNENRKYLDIGHHDERFPWPSFGEFDREQGSYFDLAVSCVDARDDLGQIIGLGDSGIASLVAGVNRALSDHLFLERGYRLHANIRTVIGVDHLLAISKQPGEEILFSRPLLVQICLVDSQGRHFSFDEVGSGLGYVLPVLCSVFHPDVTVSLLQQPELHLHPALQAALGDVLIEASGWGDCGDVLIEDAGKEKQLIIETHSEHLLLRVLKRIRQTGTNNPPPPELQLQPEDLCVIYFDPTPDGVTTVKRLRVSPDGDFLDLWPRGFFAERDQELFDE